MFLAPQDPKNNLRMYCLNSSKKKSISSSTSSTPFLIRWNASPFRSLSACFQLLATITTTVLYGSIPNTKNLQTIITQTLFSSNDVFLIKYYVCKAKTPRVADDPILKDTSPHARTLFLHNYSIPAVKRDNFVQEIILKTNATRVAVE